MSALDRLAELDKQRAAIAAEAELEAALADAKAAHSADPTAENRAAKQAIARELRAHRAATRAEGVTVGGDAFVSTPSEEV